MAFLKTIEGIKYCGETIEAYDQSLSLALQVSKNSKCSDEVVDRTLAYIHQLELIADIKNKVAKLEENTNTTDFAFDVINLLKSIKPLTNE